MNWEIIADGTGSAIAATAAAGTTAASAGAGTTDGTKLAVKDGADKDGETDKAGAVNELDGVNGMAIVPTSPTGVATRICAEDGKDNDNAAMMTAKQRGLFTMSPV